jgi:preprotein translocase subunit SecE
MNRQMKRMQERAERRQKRAPVDRAPAAQARRVAVQEKRKRTSSRQFLKEVRAELRKVDWPTRTELVAYTIVVLVTVVVVTSYVFGLDLAFSKLILNLLSS